MPLRGDDAALDSLIGKFERSVELHRRLRQEAAVEARQQVRLGFVEGRDPYGVRWAAVKRAGGRPLRETGSLANFTVTLDAAGFSLESGAHPAPHVHQYGATVYPKNAGALRFKVDGVWVSAKKVTIPKRQMVPEGSWGSIWTTAMRDRFSTAFSEHWR